MTQDEVLQLFEADSALLNGHFLLSSGLHSPQYLQCALVLQYPRHASALCDELASHFNRERLDLVIAPAIGGIIVAQEAARSLGVRAIFAERENGGLKLRRGFRIGPGERALVVEDVVTTGGSTRETMDVVRQHGGIVVGAGSIIDRSGGNVDLGETQIALATLTIPTYSPDECPLCKSGSTPVKPGSRM